MTADPRMVGPTVMTQDHSITSWILALKAGDVSAAQRLWERYYRRLVGLARARLRAVPRAAQDEEDVALVAFDGFVRGVLAHRFPRLDDRDDLWRLLVALTVRRAIDLRLHEGRDRRGGGRTRPLSEVTDDELAAACGSEPSPELAAQVVDELDALMARLPEPVLRTVAQKKLEGYTNAEIAAGLGCSLATIERKIQRIRRAWAHEVTPDPDAGPEMFPAG
jgi:RNA polymerase sigma factor (sigma-70 family)